MLCLNINTLYKFNKNKNLKNLILGEKKQVVNQVVINGYLLVYQIILIQMEHLLVSLLKTLHYGAIGQMTEQDNIIQVKLQAKRMVYIVWIII